MTKKIWPPGFVSQMVLTPNTNTLKSKAATRSREARSKPGEKNWATTKPTKEKA